VHRRREGLAEADLVRAYRSQVDPRLNAEQALELAMLIARRAPPIDIMVKLELSLFVL